MKRSNPLRQLNFVSQKFIYLLLFLHIYGLITFALIEIKLPF